MGEFDQGRRDFLKICGAFTVAKLLEPAVKDVFAASSQKEITKEALLSIQLEYGLVDLEYPLSEETMGAIEKGMIKVNGIPGLEGRALNSETQIDPKIQADLAMLVRGAGEAGISIYIRSGFRSHSAQKMALDAVGGDTTLVMPPGATQHHTGRAVDFSTPENQHTIGLNSGFGKTKAGLWLFNNAGRFGFVNSYQRGHGGVNPAAEEHHWYWTGAAVATELQRRQQREVGFDIFSLALEAYGVRPAPSLDEYSGRLLRE